MPALRLAQGRRVARILDVLILVCLGAAVSFVCFGGIRFRLGPATVSLHSMWRVTAALCVFGMARYLVSSPPSFIRRVSEAAIRGRNWCRSSTARAVLPVWMATRIGVVAAGFLALPMVGLPERATDLPAVKDPLLNLPYRWDTGWYLAIAVRGYVWDPNAAQLQQQSIAFFPAYPFLMRVGGAVLGARPAHAIPGPDAAHRVLTRTLAAGWLLALGTSAAAMCALYRWSARTVGRGPAARAVILLATFPFAVYYSAAYTESLYLLGTVSAFNAAMDRRPIHVGIWGALVGLTRPNGFLLTAPLVMLAVRHREDRIRLAVAALLPAAGMLAFSIYSWTLTGRPFAWAEAHAAWGRTMPTWQGAVTQRLDALEEEGVLGYAGTRPLEALNASAVALALALVPVVWRRLGAAPAIFVLINIVPPLVAGGLMSMGRVTSTMFPVFTALGVVIPRRHLVGWAAAFAVLQGLAAALFFTWRPLV